jgi:hypothetical protein
MVRSYTSESPDRDPQRAFSWVLTPRAAEEVYSRDYPVAVELAVLESNGTTRWTVSYAAVRRLIADFPSALSAFYDDGDGFNDWGYHELTDAGGGFLRHEVLFSSGATLLTEIREIVVNKTWPAIRCGGSDVAYAERLKSGSYFHILGSKLNGSGAPIESCANSRCVGFSTKLRSCGITTEGTDRIAVLDAWNHSSPITARVGGGGNVRQSAGNVCTWTDSMAMRSLISTGIATRSVGSMSESV